MDNVLTLIANLASAAANFGAGYLSCGILYAPKLPEELCYKES